MHWWWRYYPLPTPMTNQNSKSTRFLTKNWSKWILKKSTCLRQKVANIFNHIFIANCRMANIFFLNHSPNACASFEYHYKGHYTSPRRLPVIFCHHIFFTGSLNFLDLAIEVLGCTHNPNPLLALSGALYTRSSSFPMIGDLLVLKRYRKNGIF